MKVILYSEITPKDWDSVCDHSGAAWLFHRSHWVSIETTYSNYENHSFAIAEGRRLVAIQPLYLSDAASGAADERLLHCGIHRHTGLACLDELDSSRRNAVRACAMRHIHEIAKRASANRIQLNCQNLAPQCREGQREEIPFWVLDYGYYFGLNYSPTGIAPAPGMATCNADQVILLSDSEENLFAKLDESCRRAVRKAQKSNLVFSVESDDAVARYYQLAQYSAMRTGETLAPLGYFEAIWQSLHSQQRCLIAFVQHDGLDVAALLLGIDKHAATYLGGVSDPSALHLRVNDFLHFQAMCWLKRIGVEAYRLGPVFPEVPQDWPIARVSKFKKKFGGRNVPIIQGSYFLTPGNYLARAEAALMARCLASSPAAQSGDQGEDSALLKISGEERQSIAEILSCYGIPRGAYTFSGDGVESSVIFFSKAVGNLPGVAVTREVSTEYLYKDAKRSYFWRPRSLPAYRTLLPHYVFSGPAIEPILSTSKGGAVVAWYNSANEGRKLLIGVDVPGEIVRYRQGDPAKVDEVAERGAFGFDFERPNYLYRDQLDLNYPHFPWADMLGYCLAECVAEMANIPLIEPLPGGKKGLVVLTGDDDQAYLEKYAEQRACIGDLPITYFLVAQTRHSAETLRDMPGPFEIGVHPDALDSPNNYDEICIEQTQFVRRISERPVRTVRNHGFLNRGYWGHLPAWERAGLIGDVNCPGTDGTALNGSLLPMRVKRPDGVWSSHLSLLTAFGDGMLYGLGLSQREAIRKIRRSADLIEAGRPGVLVFNLHPQNISDTRKLHVEAVRLARRTGWEAVDLESFLDWSGVRSQITAARENGQWVLFSDTPIERLVVRVRKTEGWETIKLPAMDRAGVKVGKES